MVEASLDSPISGTADRSEKEVIRSADGENRDCYSMVQFNSMESFPTSSHPP